MDLVDQFYRAVLSAVIHIGNPVSEDFGTFEDITFVDEIQNLPEVIVAERCFIVQFQL